MTLLTASDLEAHSQGRVSADTPGLDSVVSRAQDAVLSYCQWHVAPEIRETLTLDGSGTRLLQIPSLRVAEVVSITEDGKEIPQEHYDWSAAGLVSLRHPGRVWSDRYRSIEITLRHGFDRLPPELETVILGIALRASASPLGETTIRVGDRMSVFGGVGTSPMATEYQILDRYRVRVER